MAIEKLRPSFTFTEERLKELQQVVPEAFADGKINWDTLKEALGEYTEEEGADAEHFGLNWPGKRLARKMAAMPSKGTLIPVPGEGIDEETTRNIFIEGENLEVLKLLQKSYAGRIKMIYIDPPYNTGNDFVYEDDFTEPLEEYLRRTGQLDEEGKLQSTNKRESGRFHSKWLSMMYPRLRLARNLMRDDAIIFINIDHNENSNLRLMMNEIFGEENFLADVIWKHTQQSKNDERFFSRHYNNLLVYAKTQDLDSLRFPRSDSDNKNYSNPDKDPKGDWRSGDVRSPNFRKTLRYNITTPSGKKISPPENGWRWSEKEVLRKISTKEIIFASDESKIIRKIYLKEQDGRTPENVWIGEEFGTTRAANAELKELFGGDVFFDTPKPTNLIIKILDLAFDEKDFIMLDFFAGSGTTAHGIFRKNLLDNGNRQFITVQLDEPIGEKIDDKKKYKTISNFSKERIKRASKKLKKEFAKSENDLGFKIFKLATSNYSNWSDYSGKSSKELETLFSNAVSPLVKGWKPENLLSEIMLIEGFPLDSKIETVKTKNTLQTISSDFYEHKLLVCLDKKLDRTTVANLKLEGDDIFICLDSAISDEDKVRLADKGKIKTI